MMQEGIKPLLSVITPVHAATSPFIDDAYQGLLRQTFLLWEWIIVLNGGGTVPEHILEDPRVRVYEVDDDDATKKTNRIGRIKRFGCDQGAGDILVELDADDILTDDALESIAAAFSDPKIHMAYSNSAIFSCRGLQPAVTTIDYGWRTREFEWKGHCLQEKIGWPPSVHMMRSVEWAPYNARAYRKTSYHEVGGHDPEIWLAEDHDLCCRFYIKYGHVGLRHIDKCLYLIRIHGLNSHIVFVCEDIEQSKSNYLKHCTQMMNRWADDSGLIKVDLVDLDPDIIANLKNDWPWADNSVGVISASHVFERLSDPVHAMNEAYRVLAPGGWFVVEALSTVWNPNSMLDYTDEIWAQAIRPQYNGRFQLTWAGPSCNSDLKNVARADLIALKEPYSDRPVGPIQI
jgi:O-antigen biosynthesis protein